MDEFDNARNQLLYFWLVVNAIYERTVNLDICGVISQQVSCVGVACSVIVNSELYTASAESVVDYSKMVIVQLSLLFQRISDFLY